MVTIMENLDDLTFSRGLTAIVCLPLHSCARRADGQGD